MRDLFDKLECWQRDGEAIALATLVRVHGSAPRLPGARMLITRSGKMAGSVSGGCVEADIVTRAWDVLDEGQAVLARYGIADDSELAVGLACAEIEVFIEPFRDGPVWRATRAALAEHQPAVLAMTLTPAASAGRSLLVGPDGIVTGTLGPEVDQQVLAGAPSMLGTGAISLLTVDAVAGESLVFVEAFARPDRLVISGGSHTAAVLAQMAKRIGMHVTVVDARSAYLGRERFPDADALVHASPGKALAALDLAGAFVVTLTHDLKFDVPALVAALRGGAAYVGAMGSLKTHGIRCAALIEQGVAAEDLARIRTPIGLDLGSRRPEEIAVAILAEMLAVRSGRDARPLREHGVVHDDSRTRAAVAGRGR
jgi:xanthine dehydrogenase accessory factor